MMKSNKYISSNRKVWYDFVDDNDSTWIFAGIILLFIIMIACISWAKTIDRPWIADEAETAFAIKTILGEGRAMRLYGGTADFVPPLYFHILAFISNIFGFSPMLIRGFGIVTVLLTALMSVYIYLLCFGRDAALSSTLWFLVLFFSMPAVIQGATLVEIDTTILPLLIMMSLYFMIANTNLKKTGTWFEAFLLAFCLLVKPTTVFALLPCFVVAHFDIYMFREACLKLLLFFVKLVVFYSVGSFIMYYSLGYNLLDSYTHIMSKLAVHNADGFLLVNLLKAPLLSALSFLLWMNIFSMIVLLLAALDIIKTILRRNPFTPLFYLELFAVIVFFTYSIVGGITFAYPRYFYPLFPVLSLIILFLIKREETLARSDGTYISILLGSMICIAYIIFPDPLYQFSVVFRSAYIFADKSLFFVFLPILLFLLYQIIVCGAVWIFLHIKGRQGLFRTFRIAVYFSFIAMNIFLGLTQMTARYETAYNYGGEKTDVLIKTLKQDVSFGHRVLAPIGIALSSETGIYVRGESVWKDSRLLRAFLSDHDIDVIVAGIRSNTVASMKMLTGQSNVAEYLREHFVLEQIGNYYIWREK